MIIKTRSATAAQKIADERGLAEGTYTITKVATAKYELAFETKPAAEILAAIENPTVFDVLGVALLADHQFKEALVAKAKRVNRHWNDDGSLTLYVDGIKLRRIGGEECENEDEAEDPEAFAETYLNRKFLKKAGGWVWGRTTQGHNWHTKRQKALRARIAEAEAAGQDTAELVAELAKIGGK